MQHWLEWAITRPVEALQKRIEAVGGGDFTADPAVEWPNELGDIGRGINKLAADVDGLMNRRVEDERKNRSWNTGCSKARSTPTLSTIP